MEISFIQNPYVTHREFVDIFTIEKISKDQADGRELSLFIHNLLQPQSGLPGSCTLGRVSKAARGGETALWEGKARDTLGGLLDLMWLAGVDVLRLAGPYLGRRAIRSAGGR